MRYHEYVDYPAETLSAHLRVHSTWADRIDANWREVDGESPRERIHRTHHTDEETPVLRRLHESGA